MISFSRETPGNEVVDKFKQLVKGKTIVLTGASQGGLGAETVISLARGGPAQIVLLGRSATKVNPVVDKIRKLNFSIKANFVSVELDDFESVRKAAAEVNSAVEKIDILINNAGIMAVKDFTTNKNGIESQFATNHLGHFLFTCLLFDNIVAAGKGARIVNVTSDGYKIGPCRLEDYNFKNGKDYDLWSGYGQSKTANILFTRQLATKLADRGILSFAVHPGVIMSTSLGNHLDESVFSQIDGITFKNTGEHFTVGKPKTSQQGVSTTLVAALDPGVADDSGSYFEDCAVVPLREYASSLEIAQKLWTLSEELVGEKFRL